MRPGPTAHGYTSARLPSADPVRRFERGDMFHVDCYGSYGGYFFDFARSRVVGDDPTPTQLDLLESVIAPVEVTCAAIKPGMTAGEVYAVADEWLTGSEFVGSIPAEEPEMEGFPAVGHGLGLMWEAPWLMKDDPTPDRAQHVPRGRGAARPPLRGRSSVRAQRDRDRDRLRGADHRPQPLVVIFALVAGARLDGNTAAAIADLMYGAEFGGARGKIELLTPSTVQPIGDCAPCVQRGTCMIEDGFDSLMERVYAADCLVLGTPLYWYGPSAQLKAFIDRWSCLLDLEEDAFRARMRGKRTVLVLAQGERGFYEAAPALQMLEWSLRYLDMLLVGPDRRRRAREDRLPGRPRAARPRARRRARDRLGANRGRDAAVVSPAARARRGARWDLLALPSHREVTVHEAPVFEHERHAGG